MTTLTTPLSATSSAAKPAVPRDHHGGAATLTTLNSTTAQDLVQLFKLVADETRLRILYYLIQTEELNVRTFCRLLKQSQPAVSHHLALLRAAGVLERRRDGKHNFYRLVPQRCQAYLDVVLGVTGDETRKLRIEEALLTYGHDRQALA